MLGSLQFDPLEAPGARNHDLVLHARIAGYRRALCDRLLYPQQTDDKRRLFEAYNKALNLLPIDELPWHRFAWKRADAGHAGQLVRAHARLAKRILDRIKAEGPLAPSAFEASEGNTKIDGYWGTPTSLTRHVLDALFMTGRVAIAHREGNKRTYDLAEKLIDGEVLARRVSDDEAKQHRLLSRHRGVGLMGARGAPELVNGIAPAPERKRLLAKLIDRGVLLEVEVERVRGVRHVIATERDILDASKRASRRPPSVTFLAPLDPLMWDRDFVRELFAFDYKWEVYTPEHQRKHGYYVLPVLFGDRLVARIEPRFDRARKELLIADLWLQPGFDLNEPGFADATSEALRAYAKFVGADRTTFGRGKTCKQLAVTVAPR